MRCLAKNKLAEIRLTLLFSQSDFAKGLCVSRRTLSKWENMPIPPADGHLILSLYDFGVNPIYLYRENQAMFISGMDIKKVVYRISSII